QESSDRAEGDGSTRAVRNIVVVELAIFDAESHGVSAVNPGNRVRILLSQVAANLRESVDAAEDEGPGGRDLQEDARARSNAVLPGKPIEDLRKGDVHAVHPNMKLIANGRSDDVSFTNRKEIAVRGTRIAETRKVVALQRGLRALVAVG